MPINKGELGGYDKPLEDETPFFVLLEDDKLITHASIETDALLEPVGHGFQENDARVVITVKIRPYDVNPGNMSFG